MDIVHFSCLYFIMFFPIFYGICTRCSRTDLLKCNDLFSVQPLEDGGLPTAVSYCIRFFFKFVIK